MGSSCSARQKLVPRRSLVTTRSLHNIKCPETFDEAVRFVEIAERKRWFNLMTLVDLKNLQQSKGLHERMTFLLVVQCKHEQLVSNVTPLQALLHVTRDVPIRASLLFWNIECCVYSNVLDTNALIVSENGCDLLLNGTKDWTAPLRLTLHGNQNWTTPLMFCEIICDIGLIFRDDALSYPIKINFLNEFIRYQVNNVLMEELRDILPKYIIHIVQLLTDVRLCTHYCNM